MNKPVYRHTLITQDADILAITYTQLWTSHGGKYLISINRALTAYLESLFMCF